MATQSAVLPAGVWTDVATALSLTAGSTYTLEAYGQTVELIEDNTAPDGSVIPHRLFPGTWYSAAVPAVGGFWCKPLQADIDGAIVVTEAP